MQTAATILMSLGADLVNAGQISSSQAGTPDMSFAQSFDESAAQIIEAQPKVAENEVLADEAGAKAGILMKSVEATALLAGSDVKAQANVSTNPANGVAKNNLSALADAQVPANALEKLKAKLAEASSLLTHGNPKALKPAAIPMESSDAQAVSDTTEALALDSSSKTAVEENADVTAEVIASQADVAKVRDPSAQPCTEISSVQNDKQILVPDDKQDDLSMKTIKPRDISLKSEGTAKREKTEKISESSGKKVDVQTLVATGIPVIAPLADGTQSGAIAPQVDGAPSSAASVASNSRIGLIGETEHKPGKKAIAQGTCNDGGAKPSNSASPDESASKKLSTEASKPGASPAIPDDKPNSKSQSSVPAIATVDVARIGGEWGNNKSVHVAVAGPHSTGDSMHPQDVHTGAGMPPGSNTMDTLPPMDAAHKTLQATPATLEVGVVDGSRGWLKIRAEMADGGGVNASLSTASSSGQDILHKELPSLTAYLQSEHIAVNRVIIQPTPATISDPRAFAGGMNNDGREQSRQSGNQGGENRQNASSTALGRLEQPRISSISESRGDELFSSFPYSSGGNWLSVRA